MLQTVAHLFEFLMILKKANLKKKWRIEINFASADKLSILFFADIYIRKTYVILLLCDIFVC